MMNITPVVKQLLIINIIFFIGSQFVPNAYPVLSLFYPESENFRIWQPLTHMFMHGNLMHIAFNMFGLYSFGSMLEHFWGSKKFLFFYISCGLGAALIHTGVNYLQIHSLLDEVASLNLSSTQIHTLLNADLASLFDANGQMVAGNIKTMLTNAHTTQEQFNAITQAAIISQSTVVGASGAIYGLLAAFAFMFPNMELMLMFIPVPIKAKYFVPVLICIDLFAGVTGSSVMGGNIAHFAHVGGALFGLIMVWYWKRNQYNNNRWN